jgi:hypothetical protein
MKTGVLGLGLLVAIAVGSLTAMSASATVSGHFTHDAVGGQASITAREGGTHRVKISSDGGTPIECDTAVYHGTMSSSTTTTIALTPTYFACHTEGGAPGSVAIDSSNCHWILHSRSSQHATAGIYCPFENGGIVITHPNCTLRLQSQTGTGVTYTTTTENGKHQITLNYTVSNLIIFYESGICIFLGKTHSAVVVGSYTMEATDKNGQLVNLTAT